MSEGTIDGQPYPIAIGDNGQTLWNTIEVARERDEIWDDWSLGIGETKQETGRGYFFSRGFDATAKGALRLSPFYHNLNNTDLTTGYGYVMENVEAAGSTVVIDTTNSGTSNASGNLTALGGTLTFAHTCDSNDERILIVGLEIDSIIATPTILATFIRITYDGSTLTFLGSKAGASGTDVTVGLWYLLSPATGANNIVVTNNFTAALDVVAGTVSYNGVDQDTPFGTVVGTTGTDGAPTATVTTASNEEIIAVVGIEGTERVSAGTSETEKWDATEDAGSGSGFTQDGGADGGDGVMAPSLDAQAGTEKWVEIAVSIKPGTAGSKSTVYISDTTKIFQYTYDSDTGLTLEATDTTASGAAGRPAKMNGNWYAPMGSGASAQKLTGVTWADVTGTWNADHLATFQKGVTPTLARVNATTQNTVELNADTGDVTDTWTNESEKVGDTSTKITDLVEAQGQLMVAKEDTLYRFGSEAESFSVIPFLDRGKVDPDNGKGMDAFGDEVVYPSKGNLWRHKLGGGSLPIGVNTIAGWRKVSAISTPKDGRHTFEIHVEGYRYTLLNDGQQSHLLQRRGGSNIFHSVLTIPLSKGMGVDSKKRLWLKGASTDESERDIRVIQLADDGSLDVENRKGQVGDAGPFSGIHDIYFDERNPGRPQDQVQLRRFTVELEGDWSTDATLTLAVWRDNNTSAETVGTAITAAGVTTRTWTIGTNDTAFRFRLQLRAATSSFYSPKSSQPDVLRVIVGIHFPEIIRIVIPADDGVLKDYSLTAIDTEQNLQRLQNQGTVTFLRPDTNTTFSAEIFEVTDVMYATQTGFAHGIQLQLRKWITP